MKKKYLILGATIINEGHAFKGSVLINNGLISMIMPGEFSGMDGVEIIDGEGKWLLPGVIDDQVHFRDPGLTHKGDIYTESRAAVAGGVTSYMEMPNTVPNTLTQLLLEEKYRMASEKSLANFSFYMGASNDNLSEILNTDPLTVCGIKVFMGASTGNMLVDNPETLENIFKFAPTLVAVHCEDEETIRTNTKAAINKYGETIPFSAHPEIRSSEACYKSSSLAVKLAKKYNTRLHILHLSTASELDLLSRSQANADKRITAEVCVHHLWFSDNDYDKLGPKIKWNPSIKAVSDREALRNALLDGRLDVVATDHAPHTGEEKSRPYSSCPSGGPLVQHSLAAMLELCHSNQLSPAMVVEKMCHAPARIFSIDRRGFIRQGYHADLVLVDPNAPWTVRPENILYKCGWSPFEGQTFHSKITHTFVGGHLAWHNGVFDESETGCRLLFNRQ
ncbi:MAG: dihydroorotase [Lentimicrobiaceae bacterium]|nr:dihydroorotase [Lentimicrobiaceae bacterium]MCO5266633.1 dihydroorotase [Lentimicrobium sp.]